MQSTDSGNHQTRSISNDHGFAPFGKSSASVRSKCNPARLDRELSSAAQIASVENTLSGRTIGDLEKDYMLHKYDSLDSLDDVVSDDSENAGNTQIFFCRATLFDSVMDFLDRYDRTTMQQQSIRSER